MFGQIVAMLEADSKAEGIRSKVWIAEEDCRSGSCLLLGLAVGG
jgi:hypothetical protein